MKNITLIVSAIVLSIFSVNAQDKMYVMQSGTPTEFTVAAVDSIIFYAPPTDPGPGGGGTPADLSCTVGTEGSLSSVTSNILNADFTGAYFDGDTSKEFNTGPGTGTVGSISSMDWTWVIGSASWGSTGNGTVTNTGDKLTITPTGNQNFEYDLALLHGSDQYVNGQSYTVQFEASSAAKKYISATIRECSASCSFNMSFTRTFEVNPTTKTYQFDFVYKGATGYAQFFIRVGGDNTAITIDNLKIGTGSLSTPAPTGCKLNILPIGDSITQGGSGLNEFTDGFKIMYGATYRQELYYKLEALGYDVNMIGTMDRVSDANNDDPFGGIPHINGDETTVGGWDSDCEAYWGDTTEELVGYLQANSSSWEAIPDIALIHIGTNNLLNTTTKNTTDYKAIIAHLRTVNPKIKIYIAKLLKIWEKADAGAGIVPLAQAAEVDTYNNVVISAVAAESTTESPIYVVDQNSTLTYPTFIESGGSLTINNRTDWEDPFHPTQFGALKMANVWLDAILANMPF